MLADGEVAQVRHLAPTDAEPAADDECDGVPVDAGTVAFVDADAVTSCIPQGNWYEGLFDNDTDTSWFALMDSPNPLRAGCANIVLPNASAGENVILAHSGWRDGFYPVLGTFDADGRLLGVHIDLLVAGPQDEDVDESQV